MLTLPATRLLIPSRSTRERLLERGRLLDVLTERQRKLMLLVAPAGFGKTTLALDYVASMQLWQVGSVTAWLSLDLGGIIKWDTRLFLQALSLALKNALPTLDLSIVEGELKSLLTTNDFPEEIAASLVFAISNIIAQQPRPILLVIDDYHLVCDERAVHDAKLINDIVNTLLLTSPSHLRLLISSRVYPTLDVLKLTMNDELSVIDKNQLKFTQAEIAAFLSLRGKDVSLVAQVIQESEGWAAAVALKLQNIEIETHLQTQNYGGMLVASSRYNTLAQEMLKQLDKPLRRLLEACSIVDLTITLPLALRLITCYEAVETAIAEDVVAAQLQNLEKNGLIERFNIMDSLNSDLIYRLHNLLKEYLENSLTSVATEALNTVACQYYHEIGDWSLAFEHALKASKPAQAAEILEERAFEQFKSSNVVELEQHVERLEDATLDKHPHLLLVAGMASFTAGHTDKALAYFHSANRQWGRYAPLDRLVYSEEFEVAALVKIEKSPLEPFRLLNKAETLVCMAKLWQVTGRNSKAIATLEGIKNLLIELHGESEQIESRRLYVLALTCRHLGNCYRLIGRHNESIEELTRAINIFMDIEDGYNIACCRQNLGIAWRKLGNQARAELNFRQSLEYWERQGNPNQLSNTLNSLAVGLINEGRYKEAVELLQQALEKAREAGHEAMNHYILAGLGDAWLGLRDKAKAVSYYAQAGAEAGRQNNYEMLTYAKLGAARALRRAGEPVQTRQAVLAALDYAEESSDGDRATAAVENGAYQVLYSRVELAQAQLDGALILAHKVQARQTEALAHFWLAYMHFKIGRYKLATDHVRKAINLAQELGYDAFLHEEAAELADFADHFRVNSSDPIGAFFARGDDYAADADTKVELRAFGKGRIFRGGQEVPSVSRKARELIFLLLEQKIPVSGERISETLWPDSQLAGNGLGSGFYSTITHARRALGSSESIRAADGSYSLNVRYRYDVEQFEETLGRAERLKEPDGQATLLQTALELVVGDFLADTYSDWVQIRREELEQKRLRALRLTATIYITQGKREEALEILLRLMNVDLFDEQSLRAYVELLAEVKSRTVAFNFLRRKIEELSTKGVEAEDITKALLDQLDSSRAISRRRKV